MTIMDFNLDSLRAYLEKVGLSRFWPSKPPEAGSEDVPVPEAAPEAEDPSSVTRALVGVASIIEEFHFPPDIIGGVCPHVPGEEEDIIWNAAAEACDTERVHVVWQVFDSRIWYLAVRSADLASHPNSWCPFAAFLPGMKESLSLPICCTYYGEEVASMMMISEDGLHIYRGTNPIIRAKVERTAQSLGQVSIIDLVPERIAALTPLPWYSMSLFENRARRILAAAAVALSLVLTSLSFVVWLLASLSLVSARHDLSAAIERTQSKTVQLLATAQDVRATPVRAALTKFVDINEGLLDLNGYLEVYAIKGNKVRWRATVPSNVTADRINALGGKTIDTKPNGTVIGNAAQIEFEASGGKK